jgi:hypothetical protein
MAPKGCFGGRSIARSPDDLLFPVANRLLPLRSYGHPVFPPMAHFAEDVLILVPNHLLRCPPPKRHSPGLPMAPLSDDLLVLIALRQTRLPDHPWSSRAHLADLRRPPEICRHLYPHQRCQLSNKGLELSPPPTLIPEVIAQRGSLLHERGRHGAAGVWGGVISV